MKNIRALVPGLAAVMILGLWTSAAAEQVDNPAYASWTRHKPGTQVSMQTKIEAQGMAITQTMTQTLQEITPDKAVVEIAMVMDMGGMKHETKQMQDVPAKVEKGQEQLPPEMRGTVKELGKESLTVAGKSVECTVHEFEGQSPRARPPAKSGAAPRSPETWRRWK